MSYLGALRLHFAGRFQAAVSTVNNDPTHFDNATFKPEYQERGPGATLGWWNPRGTANWRLVGCSVTSAWHGDGTAVAADDPVASCLVADSDRRAPAKLVDLDPQQQMVSEVWGLEVRICDRRGRTLLRGTYEPAPFTDIWGRAASVGGDTGASVMYQSVLSALEWDHVDDSPLLTELRHAAADGLLSIKFNVDGYDMDFRSPDFTLGRIAGTIGPASADEPHHFVAGRHLMTGAASADSLLQPSVRFNFCVAAVDEPAGKVHLDVGNALPSTAPGGPPADVGKLALVCLGPQRLALGELPYRDDGWYERTAGVVTLPSDRALTAAELETIADNPLALVRTDTAGTVTTAVAEPAGGLYVRADQFVFRLDPGATANVRLFATRYGRPYARAAIHAALDDGQLQGGDGLPPVSTPENAIRFPSPLTADDDGIATLPIEGRDPGNPRGYIDGQVYSVRPVLEDAGADYPLNPSDFISVLLWDAFDGGDPPTWAELQPVFQQYANLYPVMEGILDMADYESVCAHRDLLLLAFGLDPADPNSMPVTRDLSAAKRSAILHWLGSPGPDGKPLFGEPAPVPAARAEAAPAADAVPDAIALQGGKTAAASRRLILRSDRG